MLHRGPTCFLVIGADNLNPGKRTKRMPENPQPPNQQTATSALQPPLIHTVKEMATALTRSEKYVLDMKRAGFKLPATVDAAVKFIHKYGPPRRYRGQPLTRTQLYLQRPSCRKQP